MRPGRLCLTGLVLLLLAPPLPAAPSTEKPRLVVLLIFDQMRGDYLSRWRDLFVEDGFKRLTDDGAWFQDCHYPYANTITGPGHATISTGSLPRFHGIVGNEWHDRKVGKVVNCVGNDRFEQIPPPRTKRTEKDKEKDKDKEETYKGVCPDRLLSPTLADAIKDQLGDSARVVCLSLKDRSSALPGGKRPDACYWVDKDGQVATSTYYRDRPHAWVMAFNRSALIDRWHGKDWLRLRPGMEYGRHSGADDMKGEGTGHAQGRTFPHRLDDGPKKQRTNYYAAVANSPFGNDVLLALAKNAVEAEKLGTRDKPDFLSISFSSNDLVGHTWGPDSHEVLDVTLRSDLMVKELLAFLDEKVGRGKYVVALTADHGICPLPEVSRTRGLDARRVDPKRLHERAEEYLEERFPPCRGEEPGKGKWILSSKSNMLYLDRKRIARRGAEEGEVAAELAGWLLKQPGIAAAFTRAELLREAPGDELARLVRSSFHPERSGDVMVVLKPYHLLTSSLTGTGHGTPYAYDTHVPLVAMGPGIVPGVRKERVSPEHLPVILARALGIRPPAEARVKVPEGLFAR